ncbi:CRISPR-associated helicase Cas3' [Lactiplantibacillus plajomi]
MMTARTEELIDALWAKKTSTDEGNFWLPLQVHLSDTANTINWLFNNWISDGVRQRLAAGMSVDEAQKLVKFLGAIHDVGKATPVFQSKQSWNHNADLDETLLEKLKGAGFSDLRDSSFPDAKKSPHTIAGEALLEEAGVPLSVAAIIGAHHGRTPDKRAKKNLRDYTENYYQSDFDQQIQAPWKAVQEAILEWGLAVAGYQSVEEIPAVSQPQAVLLEGLLIMADWLASTENLAAKPVDYSLRLLKQELSGSNLVPKRVLKRVDEIQQALALPAYPDVPVASQQLATTATNVLAEAPLGELRARFNSLEACLDAAGYLNTIVQVPLFPLIGLDDPVKIDPTSRFRRAILNWHWSDNWVPERLNETGDPYQQRWGFQARDFQTTMTNQIEQATDPGMVIIEAGMGSGKTEIALLAAEQLAYKTGRNGVFMGLPTQATSDAMFKRVEQWVAKLAEHQHRNFAINLSHGKSAYNDLYQTLQRASNIDAFDPDDADDAVNAGTVSTDAWFTGKKSILTPFSVGTVDNLLMMGLKQKHLFLRHFGLSEKVVIIDEVHAYDAYMSSYLTMALTWLGAYHVPVIILSATLPKEKRNSLIDAYLRGKYGSRYEKQLVAPANWKMTTAYPLLSLVDGCEIKQVTDQSQNNGQITQEVAVERLTGDDEQLIQHVLSQLSDGGVAGIIVNTVRRAQTLAELVARVSDVKLMVLHSAFLAPDRAVQEKKLQNSIGKGQARPDKMIVIGTQVLEQSLDVDFDVMYTDIAPVDLILQRVGRLHRHQVKRPAKLRQPRLFVLGINGVGDYGDANQAIYGDYLLTKTDHFLADKITLPDDISPLVQQVYDEQTDQQIEAIEPLKAAFNKKVALQLQKAEGFQIKAPKTGKFANLLGWLDRALKSTDADSVHANAMVRDIQETLEVILVRKTATGKFLLDGRPIDSVTPKAISQQVIRIPAAVTLGKLDDAIKKLESDTQALFPAWRSEMWLRGAVALVLDANNTACLLGWRLSYSPSYGLSYQKEDE